MSPSPKSRFFYFDMTCDVISDLQVNFFYLVLVVHVIEWRFKFGNRSGSLGDLRRGPLPPPPPQQDVVLIRLQRDEG